METPILIGLHGVKRSGKNTTARFIADWAGEQSPALSALERGFADKAKLAFSRQFFPRITLEDAIKWVDTYKDSSVCIKYPMYAVGGITRSEDVPFRQALAQFATEGGRDIYGEDHWVDQLLPEGGDELWHWPNYLFNFAWKADENNYECADFCLITDLRFKNEVERIHKLGGLCWKIRRKNAEDAVIAEARQQGREVHRSELGLPDDLFDVIINNDDNDLVAAERRTREALYYMRDSTNPKSRQGVIN